MKKILLMWFSLLIVVITVIVLNEGCNGSHTKDSSDTNENDSITKLPQQASNFPALLVKRNPNDSSSVPLKMTILNMDVKVIGNIAINTMEMTFYNDLDRILEGQFCFPLGEGQSVSGFGIETNGEMRDGVIVEKAKGRVVFESTVRNNIDPGLLEWTKGNNFKTRIYPIPAKGSKRIKISFMQELISANSSFIYLQPMMFKEPIDNFSLRAEVLQQRVQPFSKNNKGMSIEFESWNSSWIAEKELKNYVPNELLSFEIPKSTAFKNTFLGEADASGNSPFYFTVDPTLQSRSKKMPQSICLVWDVSNSGKNRNIKNELTLLNDYFKKMENCKIKLITFSNTIHLKKDFSLISGNWDALKKTLEAQTFDGATQLGILNLKKQVVDEILFFSDGLSTFGKTDIELPNTPVYTICSSTTADYSMLKYIAQFTGGEFINLLQQNPEESISALNTQSYKFLKASVDSGTVTELYPSIPTNVQKTFSMAGIVTGKEATITLHFGFDNETVYTTKVKVTKENIEKGNFVKRIWAQKKINELDVLYEKNKGLITELGKENSIVTRNTSLIVLDRIEDYIANLIVPPTEAMKKEYYAALASDKKNKTDTYKSHMKQVVEDFNNRINWWKKNYPYKKYTEGSSTVTNTSGMFYMNAVSDSVVSTGTYSVRANGAANNSMNFSLSSTSQSNLSTENTNKEDESSSSGWSNNEPQNGGFQQIPEESAPVVNSSACNVSYKWENKNNESEQSEIVLKAWDSKAPYMAKLKESNAENLYETYLELKKVYENQPSFFLDAGNYFIEKGDRDAGLRILSNLAEITSEDHRSLRVLAHRLQQVGFTELAICVFREVLKIREEEPQSYRDLSLALIENKQYQEAANLLCRVINTEWDSRFPGIEVIAAGEINNLISLAENKIKLDSLDKRLIKPMPVDMRIVINWDSDNCDMDLWVTDPEKEVCMYSHNLTLNGGTISKDFTGGYGPEEFMVKKALNGKYKIQVNYFGTHEQTLFGPTTVQAELYTNYGRPNQRKKEITLRLKEDKEVVDVGELVFTK